MAALSTRKQSSDQADGFRFKRSGKMTLARATYMDLNVFFIATIIGFAIATPNAAAGPSALTTGNSTRQQTVDQVASSVENLITQLGDSQYIVRDEAESRLLKIGGPAIEPLRRVLTPRRGEHPDSEIRLRATRLLILIERNVREQTIQKFLDGKPNDLALAGWPEFSRIVGPDRAARKLFVDMHLAQPDLLNRINQEKTSVEEAYHNAATRSLRFDSYANAAQTIGTLTAMLFVSTLELSSDQNSVAGKISVSDSDIRRIQTALTQTQMVTFVNSSGNKSQLGRLISHWLSSLPDDDNSSVLIQLTVIAAYELNEQLDSVTKFFNNRRLPPTTRVTAIEIFGTLATRSEVEKLGPLLDDSTVVGNYLPRLGVANDRQTEVELPKTAGRSKLMQVQIRDLALATTIKLNQQDWGEFGFETACFSGNRLIRNYAGFFSEEDRKTALDRWATRNLIE